jgi:hypothetical protein
MQFEEAGNPTPEPPNTLAERHRTRKLGRFIMLTPLLVLDVNSSDCP